MTQRQQQPREERKYGALWFQKQGPGQYKTMRVRVLHKDVGEFLQTSTHWVQFDTKSGKKGNIRVECAKGGTYGDVRDDIYCPLDAKETYGAPKTRQWFWVQDIEDGGLKYVEMPYSIRASLETLQLNFLRGRPLHDQVFQIIRSGERVNTNYTVLPDPEFPVADFNVQGFLQTLGLDSLPSLTGDKDFPPIWSLSMEQLQGVANGVMPWQQEKKAYDPRGGQTAPQTAQPAHTYPPVGNPAEITDPGIAPVGTAPTFSQAPTGAPNPGYSPTAVPQGQGNIQDIATPHVAGVPYTVEHGQLTDEIDEFEEVRTDELPHDFY